MKAIEAFVALHRCSNDIIPVQGETQERPVGDLVQPQTLTRMIVAKVAPLTSKTSLKRGHAGDTRIQALAFGSHDYAEQTIDDIQGLAGLRDKFPMVWIDIVGFGDHALVVSLAEAVGIHELTLEDAIGANQRAKAEVHDTHFFIVAQAMAAVDKVRPEQVAIFVTEGVVITFRRHPSDLFEDVRQRLHTGQGHIRSGGPDYLCYALLDALIDGYFPVLENLGEALESLEERVVGVPDAGNITDLHALKRHMLTFRRALWPHRELFNNLIRDEPRLITPGTRPFLRDCYDHTIQLMDIVETYREIASELVDVHISSVSMRMNEVMKVLTIVATVFMPLGFIASLYGMNFDRDTSPWNMPELGWYFGYPFSLLMMIGSAAGLLWYIWKKGWFR